MQIKRYHAATRISNMKLNEAAANKTKADLARHVHISLVYQLAEAVLKEGMITFEEQMDLQRDTTIIRATIDVQQPGQEVRPRRVSTTRLAEELANKGHELMKKIWSGEKIGPPETMINQLVAYNQQEEQTMAEFWETGNQFDNTQDARKQFPKVHVLVDGDIVAYRAAAAADGRFYEVSGQRFKYSADAKAFADKKSIPNSEIYSGYEPEPVENALHTVNTTLEMIEQWFLDKKQDPIIKICLSCDRNFRYDLFPEYKANRKEQRRPEHLAACKQYLVKQHSGHVYEPFEADDLIAMLTERLVTAGKQVVIASNDKDFTQLGGPKVSFYDFTTGKEWEVSRDEAARYFYKQLLIGDKTDGIIGIPKCGPQTAIKILSGCESAKDMDLAVFNAYKAYYETMPQSKEYAADPEEKAAEHINLNAMLLRLVRSEAELEAYPLPTTAEENEE